MYRDGSVKTVSAISRFFLRISFLRPFRVTPSAEIFVDFANTHTDVQVDRQKRKAKDTVILYLSW